MKPDQCVELLKKKVAELQVDIGGLDVEEDKVKQLFRELAETSDWVNGRDIETLGKLVTGSVFKKAAEGGEVGKLAVNSKELVDIMSGVLKEKTSGEKGDWHRIYM
jgi:hypothetical protein